MGARFRRTVDWPGLARQANFSTAMLATLRGVTVRQLEREFLRTMPQSPELWLNGLRLRDALELLQEGNSVKASAFALGYKYPQSFSRAFKRFHGVSPSAMRFAAAPEA